MNNKKQTLFDKYVLKVDSLNDESFENANEGLFNGHNTILRYTKKGASRFNPTWIDKIEDCLFDLGSIVTNPRDVTAEESVVTPIELAKKVNGESVQHLASHTHFIKEVNEKGEVIPGKILSHFNKDELHTYENRFIATFVRRLLLFVEKRYEFIKSTIDLETNEVLQMRNVSVINGQEVEIETKISVKRVLEDEVTTAAKDYIARIELMRQYISYYYNTPFMKEMKNERDVRKPILQTNIIRKNPKYHKCFETFTFIERFDSLGVTYKVDEQYHTYSDAERKKLNYLLTSQFVAVQDDDTLPILKAKSKAYKPKILTSIDDEKFCYGDLLEGPIEFVRVDAGYRKYLENQINKDLPTHPTKEIRAFYANQYAQKRAILDELAEIDKLIRRVERDIHNWEKTVQKAIRQRDKEEAEEARKQLEALRKYHEDLLEEKRQKIIEAAKLYRRENDPRSKKNKEAPVKEEVLSVPEETKELEVKKEPTPEPIPEPAPEPVVEEVKEEETPVEEEAPVEEAPIEEEQLQEETPIEEEPQEEAPIEEIPEEQPEEEPVQEEQVEEPVNEEPEPEPEPEPIVEETPVEEPVNEEPEPIEEPVEEEKAEEAPAQEEPEEVLASEPEEAPVEEAPTEENPEEQPVEEVPSEETPVEEPKEEPKPKKKRKKRAKKAKPAPKEEPVQEEPQVEEPKEQEPVAEEPAPEPVIEEPVNEEPVSEPEPEPLPVEEEPQPEPVKKEKKPRKASKKKEKKPAEKKAPKEKKSKPEPKKEEPKPVVEKAPEEKKAAPKKKAAKPKKAAPAPAPVKKKEPKPKKKAPKPEKQVIPGNFIVKTMKGYYVGRNKFDNDKEKAKVFHNFIDANDIKKKEGGKVVKV